MSEQVEMFPMTRVEAAELFLEHFQEDVEKAEKSVANAINKHQEAILLRDIAEVELAKAKLEGIPVAVVDAVNAGAMGANATAEMTSRGAVVTVNTDVDPITGEVVGKAEREDEDGETSAPFGETSADDSGTIPGEPETPHVFVVWPDGQPFSAPIGEHTTYGELVADYLADSLIDLEPEDFNVVSAGGMSMPLNLAIVSASYGGRYYIQPKPTEAELAEHEALKAQEPAA